MGNTPSKSKYANLPITNHYANNPLVIIGHEHLTPSTGPVKVEVANTVRDYATGRLLYEIDHEFGFTTWKTAVRNPHTGEWLCVAKAKGGYGMVFKAYTGPDLENKKYDHEVMNIECAGRGGGASGRPVDKLVVTTATGHSLLVKTSYYGREDIVAEIVAGNGDVGGLVIARARMAIGMVTPLAEVAPGVDVCGIALLLHIANQIVYQTLVRRHG